MVRVNWPLWLGLGIVVALFALAAAGPHIAPRDPATRTAFQLVGTRAYSPPFPPGRVPGFPLGSDEQGRDVWSLLLWAMRPTLALLLVVGSLRLVLGAALGLAAGWAQGASARLLDGLIGAALAPPALVVALLTVAALESRLGVAAFVVGLTITGWAEIARAVREAARALRGQSFIEASRALGASELFVVTQHITRQIIPLLWVLVAFELSNTLLVLGTLGFLGYYLGEDVWVPVDDGVTLRIGSYPELGQMLGGTSNEFFLGPWKMFAAGTVVALLILGFNLLGRGLRRASEQRRLSFGPLFGLLYGGVRLLDRLASPFRAGARTLPLPDLPPRLRRVLAIGLLMTLVGGWWGWHTVQARNAPPPTTRSLLLAGDGIAVPGGHLWVSALHDPFGTRWSAVVGPQSARRAWSVQEEAGFVGGPVVAQDGTLFVAAGDGLLAVAADGARRWQSALPEKPIGSPALAPDGTVVVSGEAGGLMAVGNDGVLRWHLVGEGPGAGEGPIAAPDGTLFFRTSHVLRALSGEGVLRWESALPTPTDEPLRLDPSGSFLLLGPWLFDARDGVRLKHMELSASYRFFVGADGQRFYQNRSKALMRWEPRPNGTLAPQDQVTWRDGDAGALPVASGSAPDGHLWYQRSDEEEIALYWRTPDGELAGYYRLDLDEAVLIGFDRTGLGYLCGTRGLQRLICLAIPANATREAWRIEMPSTGRVVGGALAEDRLYVVTAQGALYAIGGRGR